MALRIGLVALGGDLGVEVDRRAGRRQRGVEVGGPVGDAVPVGELGQLVRVAADQHRLDLHRAAVGEQDAALVADGEDRAHQVLAVAHPAGDAVHDDAEGCVGHLGASSVVRAVSRVVFGIHVSACVSAYATIDTDPSAWQGPAGITSPDRELR